MRSQTVWSCVITSIVLGAALSSVQAGDPGNWPYGDLMNGDWVPSRSTHYGYTNTGACGQGTAANCWTGRQDGGCDKVPEGLKTPMGGLYAAPQGDYYAQVNNYVACGECFEIRCDDPHCPKNNQITVFISDACPCLGNEKWCCNVASRCNEMSTYPSSEGAPHCPALNGPWNTSLSVHLDLSDFAFALLEKGDRTLFPQEGFLNTFIRRVKCPAYNNSIHLSFASGTPSFSASCKLGRSGNVIMPCFWYILMGFMGVGGSGSIARVQYLGRWYTNQTFFDTPYEMLLQPLIGQDPQGRYGDWQAKQDITLTLPFRLRLYSRTGEVAETRDFTSDDFASLKSGGYIDTKTQFGWVTPPPLPVSSTAEPPAPQVSSSSTGKPGPKPECWAAAVDEGSSDYWFGFYVYVLPTATNAHTIASVSVLANGQSIKLSGPNNWGSITPTVYTSASGQRDPVSLPYVLRVVDTAGNINDLQVTSLGRDVAKATC